MSNMTLLSSCSLRWHNFSLLNCVCCIVSPQVLYRNEWGVFFFFMFTLVLHGYMWLWSQRSTSIIFLNCVHFIFLRSSLSLNWSSLCWLGRLASELQGYTCLYFLSAEIRSLCLCIRLFCGFWGPNSGSHVPNSGSLCSKHLPSCKMGE